MFDNIKILTAGSFLFANSVMQWISDADTCLKLIGTLIALPIAYFTSKSLYWKSKQAKIDALLKKAELDKLLEDQKKGN